MPQLEHPVGRITRRQGDHAAQAVHLHLRQLILTGVLPPGRVLKQLELASALGVSVTPIREALRMLQDEGLISAEPQKRAQVTGFDPKQVELLYVERIALEALGARMTAGAIGRPGLDRLQHTLTVMSKLAADLPGPEWHEAHKRFHLEAVSALGDSVLHAVAENIDRSARFMLMHGPENTNAWPDAELWHRAIVTSLADGDAAGAAAAVAGDLARGAILLMSYFAPDYDPTVIRSVLAQWEAQVGDPTP